MNGLVIGNNAVRQTEGGLYCLNDLHKAAGALRQNEPNLFLRGGKVKAFIECLESTTQNRVVEIQNGGINQGTYVHELIVYRYAAWISPAFEIKVYSAFRDGVTGKQEMVKIPVESYMALVRMAENNQKVVHVDAIEYTKRDFDANMLYGSRDIASHISTSLSAQDINRAFVQLKWQKRKRSGVKGYDVSKSIHRDYYKSLGPVVRWKGSFLNDNRQKIIDAVDSLV